MIFELYTNVAASLRSSSNIALLGSDTTARGKDLAERLGREGRLEAVINGSWRKMGQGGAPETMQKEIVEVYQKELNHDLFTDPELRPSLLKKSAPPSIHQSRQPDPPAPIPAMRQAIDRTSPASRQSNMEPLQASPPKPIVNRPPIREQAPRIDPLLDSGNDSGVIEDQRPSVRRSPDLPAAVARPRPKVAVLSPAETPEISRKSRSPTFADQLKDNSIHRSQQSWNDNVAKPPSRTAKPVGSQPAGGQRLDSDYLADNKSSVFRPSTPERNNLPKQSFGQHNGGQISGRKTEGKPWDYNKSTMTYSQLLNKAPTESTLFNTPGLYENERKKLRDNLMLKREMEFQQQLESARRQSRDGDVSLAKSDFRSNTGQLHYGQYVADISYNPHQEYLIHLSEKAHQSNDEVRKCQTELKMLQNSVTTSQKAADLFEKQVDRQTTQATDLNTRAESLAADISSLAQAKEDLRSKLERKRSELMDLKRKAHATSDSDHSRKREMQEENASLRRLVSFKAADKARLKAKLDQLEQEYTQHNALRTASTAKPTQVLDRLLTRSAMVDWAPWRERFDVSPGIKSRKAHADMGSTMAGDESRGFLAELNRSVDKLLMNRAESESRFV